MARKSRSLARVDDAPRSLKTYLGPRLNTLKKWTENRVNADALIRFALMEYAKNPALQKCSPESIYLALIACAQVGLEPGGVRQEAYIVPYGGVAQFQLGYRGIIRLAYESPHIKRVSANVVRAADRFRLDIGSNAVVEHAPALGIERGDVIGAYAYAVLEHGELEVEWMDAMDLDMIEATSQASRSDSPWKVWRDQMQRKSPIKRLGKRLPLSHRAALAMALDNAAESGQVEDYNEALRTQGVDVDFESPPDSGVSGLKNQLGVEDAPEENSP